MAKSKKNLENFLYNSDLCLATDDDEFSGWFELLFLGKIERSDPQKYNVPGQIITLYSHYLTQDEKTIERIKHIESMCPNASYLLFALKDQSPLLAKVPVNNSLKNTLDRKEIENYFAISLVAV
ncbi:MAG: hypothetical protein WCK29_00465 [archaeon]